MRKRVISTLLAMATTAGLFAGNVSAVYAEGKSSGVTVQGLTGLKKTDGVNWETVKAIGFLYPNILDTLSNIFSGSSKRIKTSMLMHWQR